MRSRLVVSLLPLLASAVLFGCGTLRPAPEKSAAHAESLTPPSANYSVMPTVAEADTPPPQTAPVAVNTAPAQPTAAPATATKAAPKKHRKKTGTKPVKKVYPVKAAA